MTFYQSAHVVFLLCVRQDSDFFVSQGCKYMFKEYFVADQK
jgi:hypothetical protein